MQALDAVANNLGVDAHAIAENKKSESRRRDRSRERRRERSPRGDLKDELRNEAKAAAAAAAQPPPTERGGQAAIPPPPTVAPPVTVATPDMLAKNQSNMVSLMMTKCDCQALNKLGYSYMNK